MTNLYYPLIKKQKTFPVCILNLALEFWDLFVF